MHQMTVYQNLQFFYLVTLPCLWSDSRPGTKPTWPHFPLKKGGKSMLDSGGSCFSDTVSSWSKFNYHRHHGHFFLPLSFFSGHSPWPRPGPWLRFLLTPQSSAPVIVRLTFLTVLMLQLSLEPLILMGVLPYIRPLCPLISGVQRRWL